jgi:hypothetical protein
MSRNEEAKEEDHEKVREGGMKVSKTYYWRKVG